MRKKYTFAVLILQLCFLTSVFTQDVTPPLEILKAELVAAEKSGDKAAIAEALGRLSFEQATNNNFVEATSNVEKAIELFTQLKQPKKIARCYGTLVWIHNAMHHYDKEEEYALKALEIGKTEKDTFILSIAYDALGMVCKTKKEYQKSLDYYQDALKYAEITQGGVGASHHSLAGLYLAMGNWEKALAHANSAANFLLEEQDTLRYTNDLYIQANCNAHFKQFDLSAKQMKEADALTAYLNIPESTKDMHFAHALFFQQKGDMTKAFDAMKAFYITDSLITSDEHSRQFAEFETAFKTKEKERENLALNQKIYTQYLTFGAIVLGLLGLLGFIYLQRKRLVIKNKLLEKEHDFDKKVLEQYVEMMKEKNETIDKLSNTVSSYDNSKEKDETIAQLLNASILTEEQWLDFRYKFERVHRDFFAKLQEAVPDATEAEKRLAALTKLGLSNTQIASMLGISPESVKKTKYRLNKKTEGVSLKGVLADL